MVFFSWPLSIAIYHANGVAQMILITSVFPLLSHSEHGALCFQLDRRTSVTIIAAGADADMPNVVFSFDSIAPHNKVGEKKKTKATIPITITALSAPYHQVASLLLPALHPLVQPIFRCLVRLHNLSNATWPFSYLLPLDSSATSPTPTRNFFPTIQEMRI